MVRYCSKYPTATCVSVSAVDSKIGWKYFGVFNIRSEPGLCSHDNDRLGLLNHGMELFLLIDNRLAIDIEHSNGLFLSGRPRYTWAGRVLWPTNRMRVVCGFA